VNAWRDEANKVKGHFFVSYPPPNDLAISARATCLNVVGTGAAAVGVIERTRGTSPIIPGVGLGAAIQVRVLDLAEPGTLDRADWDVSNACFGVGDLAISEGNYIVHADPPLDLLNALDPLLAEFEVAAHCPYR
jgi:hypothetical protein